MIGYAAAAMLGAVLTTCARPLSVQLGWLWRLLLIRAAAAGGGRRGRIAPFAHRSLRYQRRAHAP